MKINDITHEIISAAMKVHTTLGPGLLESPYEFCVAQELRNRGFRVATQVPVPVYYEGIKLELGFRIDLLVEDLVVVEIKAVDAITPLFKAQLLSYLRLANKPIGLLINFHATALRDGIVRMLNDWKASDCSVDLSDISVSSVVSKSK